MAHSTSKASRRAVLGRGAAGLFASAAVVALAGRTDAVAAATGGGDDAALVAVCDRMVAVTKEQRLICIADEWAPDRGPLHARYEALWTEWKELEGRIYEMADPVSPAGLQAVARAAVAGGLRHLDGDLICDGLEGWLLWSLAMFHAGPEFQAEWVQLAVRENAEESA